MTTFLFWNVRNKPLQEVITNLASQHQVDVIILAECSIPVSVMLRALNAEETQFDFPFSICEKINIYTRFSRQFLSPISESNRLTIRRLMLPGQTEILLAAVHFPDKSHWSEHSQIMECHELARAIRETESQAGHARTVLVGDFNMNPFESGVVGANGLNAAMTRQVAGRGERTVQQRQYPFFYNPMWGRFGDASTGPPGTYYYNSSEHVSFFWNMFDQVVVRPDLMNTFRDNDLEILISDGTTEFLTSNGLPNATVASDHLPIVFKLSL